MSKNSYEIVAQSIIAQLENNVAPWRKEWVARSVHDLRAFNGSIRRHCDEAALIMRAYAKEWLGKNHYRDGKQISKNDVRRFSGHAVEKIRIELDMRKGAP